MSYRQHDNSCYFFFKIQKEIFFEGRIFFRNFFSDFFRKNTPEKKNSEKNFLNFFFWERTARFLWEKFFTKNRFAPPSYKANPRVASSATPWISNRPKKWHFRIWVRTDPVLTPLLKKVVDQKKNFFLNPDSYKGDFSLR